MILLVLAALIALVARVDASGAVDDDIDLAIRYADALTSLTSDPARAPVLDARNGDEDADEDEDADDDADDDDASARQRAEQDDENDDNNDEVATEIGDRDDGGVSDAEGGQLAMLDAELDPGDTTAGGDAVYAAAPAGAAELYEQSLRHQRPSRWGRLDIGVALRRRWSEPMHAPASRRDEVWLVATWRR